MDIQSAIEQLLAQHDLTAEQMTAVMQCIMTGGATDAQIAGFLVALRAKGESVIEIAAAASVMRQLSHKVDVSSENIIDTCGTGGDGAGLFNVSTAVSFIVAAAGGHVAKHGNRSVTSSSGSADVLEAVGVNLDISAEAVARAIDEIGVGFMFAVKHHGAMKHAIGVRRELGLRTIFNILGPLTNPANAKRQVIGVYDKALLEPFAKVLKKLGSEHVIVVHAEDGLDEFSLSSINHVAELKAGDITTYTVDAKDFDLALPAMDELVVADAEQSLALIKQGLSEVDSGASKMLQLNAAAALTVAGIADSLADGISVAQDVICSGQALEKFKEFIEFTQMA